MHIACIYKNNTLLNKIFLSSIVWYRITGKLKTIAQQAIFIENKTKTRSKLFKLKPAKIKADLNLKLLTKRSANFKALQRVRVLLYALVCE